MIYKFKNKNLYNQALMHSSMSGSSSVNYERLEFLGDRVLGLCIAKLLFEAFQDEDEGALAHRLTGLVCKETVAKVALKLGLDKEMKIATQSIATSENILCDVLEAMMGAIYLDGGCEEALAFVKRNFGDLLLENIVPPKDAKSSLQELAVAKGYEFPSYEMIGKSGPEHEPVFEVLVKIKGLPDCSGVGKNKKQAEFEAAKKMLESLGCK